MCRIGTRYCLKFKGKKKYLGSFTSVHEAETTYISFKVNLILEIANKQTNPKIKIGLLRHIEKLNHKIKPTTGDVNE